MTLRGYSLALGLIGLAFPASAFDALECVGIEVCTADACTPSFLVFDIGFDWDAQRATVSGGNQPVELDVFSNTVAPNATSGSLYLINDEDAALTLFFNEAVAEMVLFTGQGDAHTAACSSGETG